MDLHLIIEFVLYNQIWPGSEREGAKIKSEVYLGHAQTALK